MLWENGELGLFKLKNWPRSAIAHGRFLIKVLTKLSDFSIIMCCELTRKPKLVSFTHFPRGFSARLVRVLPVWDILSYSNPMAYAILMIWEALQKSQVNTSCYYSVKIGSCIVLPCILIIMSQLKHFSVLSREVKDLSICIKDVIEAVNELYTICTRSLEQLLTWKEKWRYLDSQLVLV